MIQPKVRIENYEAVYDWYRQYRQPEQTAKLAYGALHNYYRPDVHISEEVRDIQSDLRRRNTPQILVPNHITNNRDQYLASATLHELAPHTVGHTRVLAKDELFHWPKLPVIRMMGGIPTFRSKDHIKGTEDEMDPESLEQLLAQQRELVNNANEYMIHSTSRIVANGEGLGVFIEGTHNKVNPTVLQKIRPGFAHIAMRSVLYGTDPVITPIGMSYGQTIETLNPKQATIVVMPSVPVSKKDTVEGLMNTTRASLQTAVTLANDINATARMR